MSYYTPNIEEFHVGFEFEKFWYDGSWSREKLEADELADIEDEMLVLTRVKYLDQEDIESLGGIQLPDTNSFDIGECQIYFQDHTYIEIYDDCARLVFQGAIKNKSELKRVLKQVGVL